jgi:CheY-like chemotaxis protein
MAMIAPARVLIVEDERIVARDLERRLRRLGYTVVALVSTGIDAVQQALQHRPDVILVDIRLQGEMDGITAVESIHQQLQVHVVYLSAHLDEATQVRAQDTHPDAFLQKPFNDAHLQQTLQQVLLQ